MFLVGSHSNSILKPLYTASLHSIKFSVYKTGMKFDKDPLAVDFRKIVNVYVVYDLDPWPRNLTNNFISKNCLFGATSMVKNSDKVCV